MAVLYHKHLWNDDFPEFGRDAYRKHNEDVRREVQDAARNLLEFDVSEGWTPLCAYLGTDVPDGVVFPRADDWKEYKAKVKAQEEQKTN
jgi:hypothetical protein